MTDQVATTRKGFSFERLDGGGVRVRVRTGERVVVDHEPVATFKEVELSAMEWIDVVTTVAEGSGAVVDREMTMRHVVDVHMGPAGRL